MGARLGTAQRLVVFLEQFRELPATSWAITTGGITVFAAVQASAMPNLTGARALWAYAMVLLVSILAAGLYATRRPTLSKLMLEARNHYRLGCVAFEDRRYSRAMEEFAQAVKKDPDNYPYVSKYGRAFIRLGEYSEAIDVLTRARDLSPTRAGRLAATRNRGVAAMVTRNWGQAHSDFTEYLKENESSPVYRSRALVALATGDIRDAKSDALKAVELASTKSAVHATLAAVQAVAGDVISARKSLEKATARNRDKAISLYALSQAHSALGDSDDAIRILAKAVQADTRFGPRARRDPLFDNLLISDHDAFIEATDTKGRMTVEPLEGEG